MLKMRREWRRTSSSQAEPSPWRYCWTSWASCSNSSSASDPGTSRPALYGTQIAAKKFPGKGFGSKGLKAGQLRENEKVGQHGGGILPLAERKASEVATSDGCLTVWPR